MSWLDPYHTGKQHEMAALSLGALGSPAASPLPAPSSLGNPSLTSRSRASSHRAVGVGIDNVEFRPALLIHRSFLEQHDRPLGPIPIPGCLGSSGSAWGLPSYRHLCCRRLINRFPSTSFNWPPNSDCLYVGQPDLWLWNLWGFLLAVCNPPNWHPACGLASVLYLT